jgi:(p)ppGpp synthase/HD superfamily hydrolase
VLDVGGTEEKAVAALLHDAFEDGGGMEAAVRIQTGFGSDVRRIVEALSDTHETPKPPWKARKLACLEQLRACDDPRVLRVSAADRLHSVRAIVRDYRAVGEALSERFRGGREGTLRYYRALADLYLERGPATLGAEVGRAVRQLEDVAVRALEDPAKMEME